MAITTNYTMGVPASRRKQRGHTAPKAPMIRLDQPGRLRLANLLALFNCAHSTFYDRMKCGRYPKPDGYDGKCPYWKTSTIRAFLDT
jgi:predicted DNA-binding transcriptional regulator AlpA